MTCDSMCWLWFGKPCWPITFLLETLADEIRDCSEPEYDSDFGDYKGSIGASSWMTLPAWHSAETFPGSDFGPEGIICYVITFEMRVLWEYTLRAFVCGRCELPMF